MKKKHVTGSALMMLLSMVVGLFIVEISLRFFDLGYGHTPRESHPVFHHVHPRSYKFLSHTPSGEYGGHHVFYDQHGLVSDPEGGASKVGNCRIAFLGDSFTEAGQIAYKKSFVGLLNSATNCTVLNYGVSSYSPIFYYLQWKHSIRQSKPDIVIVQLYSNDMESDDKYFRQAKFSADGKPVAIPGPSGGWFVKQLRKSYVLRLLWKVQLTTEWALSHWGERKDVVGDFVEENPDISEISSDMLMLLNKEVIDSGAKLALFTVPSKIRLSNQDRTYAEPEFADKWKAWASAKEINYIDLVGPFKKATLRGERLFFESDIHFNEKGHAIVAGTILRTYQAVFQTD